MNKTVESAEDFADDDSYDSYTSEPAILVDETQHAISSFRSISSLMLPRGALETALPETLESTVKSQSLYSRKRDTTLRLRGVWRHKWHSLMGRTRRITCVRSTSV
jgi:hypothetical protein